jgi:DNA-binding NarL/FixJ family response regulator
MDKVDNVNMEVLLAEDDQDDVLLFQLALKEMTFPTHLRHAENGEVLFTLLKQYIPDLLFLDIHMPCKDGVSCIIEIRKNKEYDNLPVVMYTSHSTENYIDDCFRNGANLYLIKNKTFRELVENLRTIFSFDWKKQMFYPPKQQFVLS